MSMLPSQRPPVTQIQALCSTAVINAWMSLCIAITTTATQCDRQYASPLHCTHLEPGFDDAGKSALLLLRQASFVDNLLPRFNRLVAPTQHFLVGDWQTTGCLLQHKPTTSSVQCCKQWSTDLQLYVPSDTKMGQFGDALPSQSLD